MASRSKKKKHPLSRKGKTRDFLYRQIAAEVCAEIDAGAYAPGERLPSMDELAAHFDVNKITVLKALDELKGEGVIYSVPAQGTYVTKVEPPRARDNANKVFTVGLLSHVLCPSRFGPYHMGIIGSVQEELSRRKGNLLLMPAGRVQSDAEMYRTAMEATVDAMIYLGPFHNALLTRMIQSGCPAVVVDYVYPGCPTDSVLADNVGGGYQAMEHLLERGHRRIAVIRGPADQAATLDRMQGIRRALATEELTEGDLVLIDGDFTRESGLAAAARILKKHPDCTALCCMNDEMAAGALQAIFGQSSRSVPADLSVIGFDDIHLSVATHPPLTSVHVDIRHMGRIAVQRLMDRIEDPGASPSSTLISTKLVIRDSTGRLTPSTRPALSSDPVPPDQP